MTGTLPAAGNRERIGAWADFVYTYRGGVTHVLPHLGSIYGTRSSGAVLCGRMPSAFNDWLGTGNQTEHDQARRMPLCIRCMERAEGRTR